MYPQWAWPLVAALSVIAVPVRAGAQAQVAVGVDASVGGARGAGGEFFDRRFAAARLAAHARVPLLRGVGFVAEVGYEWFGFVSGHKAICYPNPRGGCLPPFPAVGGPAALVGVSIEPTRAAELRAAIGTAAYNINDTRLGAIVGHVDAAFYPTAGFGFVGGARSIAIPRYQGDRLTVTQWFIGVRLRQRRSRP